MLLAFKGKADRNLVEATAGLSMSWSKSSSDLLRCVRRLAEARTRLIGLVALDTNGAAVFNRSAAEKLAGLGMHVAAMTPDRFAEWLVGIMD